MLDKLKQLIKDFIIKCKCSCCNDTVVDAVEDVVHEVIDGVEEVVHEVIDELPQNIQIVLDTIIEKEFDDLQDTVDEFAKDIKQDIKQHGIHHIHIENSPITINKHIQKMPDLKL